MPTHRQRMVYDAFLFDGEFALLEHRLRECYALVDFFVLVEAGETFQGSRKALHFSESGARFDWAKDKIRIIAIKHFTAGLTAWQREQLQRNAVMLGLRDAQPDDVVLLLDADEIPSESLLRRLRSDGLDRPRRLAMTRHYGRLNWVAPGSACCPDALDPLPGALNRLKPPAWTNLEAPWLGHSGAAVRYVDLSGDATRCLPPRSAFQLRSRMPHAPTLPEAGRHLNAVDAVERLSQKLKHGAHQELATGRGTSAVHLFRTLRYGVHHCGWWYAELPTGTLPADLVCLQSSAPALAATIKLPPMLLRRLVCTWAWLRQDRHISDGIVARIDHHFEVLLPLLVVPLVLADAGRRIAAALWERRTETAEVTPAVHLH